MRDSYPCRGNSGPRGRRDGRFGQLMLLNHNVKVESGKRIFKKINRGSDHKEPHRHIKEFGLYLKWHEEAIKCFQQVNNMIKFVV